MNIKNLMTTRIAKLEVGMIRWRQAYENMMCRKQKWRAYYYVYRNLCNSNKKDSEDGYFLYRLFARQQDENSGEILASILL